MAGVKIHRVLCLLVLCIAIATVLCEVHPDGVSEQVSSQDGLGNYQFSYSVNTADGEHFRREGTDAEGRVVGSYGLTEADGRHRIVDYVADASGFHAHVRSNEPGVAASSPAAVTVDKTGYAGGGSQLDIAATSLSPYRGSSQSIPNGVFGARLTPIQANIPHQQAVVADHSFRQRPVNPSRFQPEGVAAAVQIPQIKQQPASSNPSNPIVYRPPIHPSQALKPQDYHQPDSPLGVQSQYQSLPPHLPSSSSSSRSPGLYPPPYATYDGPSYHLIPRSEINRYPQVSMSTVHGGLGRTPYIAVPQQQQHLGVSQLPSSMPYQQGYSPSHPGRPLVSSVDGSTVSTQGATRPNIVLRAMPIPNGIQAVPVDSSTGQVYGGTDYPIYGNQDISNIQGFNRGQTRHTDYDDTPSNQRSYGQPQYQRGNLLPETNSQVDTTNYRNNVRASLSGQRGNDYSRNRPLEPPSFSSPSARDLASISGQLGYGNNLNYNNYPVGANSFQPNPYFNYQNAPNGNPGYYGLTGVDHPGYQNRFSPNSSPDGYNPYFGSSPYPPSSLYSPYNDPQTRAPRYQDPNQYASSSELKPVIDLAPAASNQNDKTETPLPAEKSSSQEDEDETSKSD